MENFFASETIACIFAAYAFVVTAFFVGYRTLIRLFEDNETNLWIAALENALVLTALGIILTISPINLFSFVSLLAILVCGVAFCYTIGILTTSMVVFYSNVKIRYALQAITFMKKLHPTATIQECTLRVYQDAHFWRVKYLISDKLNVMCISLAGEEIATQGETEHAAGTSFVIGENLLGRKIYAYSTVSSIDNPFEERIYLSSKI